MIDGQAFTKAREHLAPHLFSIFFRFFGFKGFKQRVGRIGHVAQFPGFASGVRGARKPERIHARLLYRNVPEKLILA